MSTHVTGLAAEENVVNYISARGANVLDRRWRCRDGELDLVSSQDDMIVFTEVKARRSIEEAAASITPRQIHRIGSAAARWLAAHDAAPDTAIRIDAALLDRYGRIEIIENAGMI